MRSLVECLSDRVTVNEGVVSTALGVGLGLVALKALGAIAKKGAKMLFNAEAGIVRSQIRRKQDEFSITLIEMIANNPLLKVKIAENTITKQEIKNEIYASVSFVRKNSRKINDSDLNSILKLMDTLWSNTHGFGKELSAEASIASTSLLDDLCDDLTEITYNALQEAHAKLS